MQHKLALLGPRPPEEYQRAIENIPPEITGSEFVKTGYENYQHLYNTSAPSQRNKNGEVFEWLILQALCQAQIYPAYYQATVLHVPHVVYDILLYHKTHPIVLSCKVSLRERWKQADLEALALRQVYRGAYSILLTLNSSEGTRVQRQINESEVLGLNECVVIQSREDRFDDLILELQQRQFDFVEPVIPVQGGVVTNENFP